MKLAFLASILIISYPISGHADFKDGGKAYIEGDYETAAAEFIPLAKRGDHRAMYALGSMYAAGQGVEKNLKRSFELFSEAAKNGRADAMYKLGLMYEQGLWVKQNHKKSIRYYQKSAKKGYPLGQYKLGLMYEQGLGIKESLVNAYAWLVIAGHYFIYTSAPSEFENNGIKNNAKQDLILFQEKEKDKVFEQITMHLQSIKPKLQAEDIEKVKIKVSKLSKYRKRYHSDKIKKLKIEPNIENLFLPDTIY
jgi:Sel1 repeat-containing protein